MRRFAASSPADRAIRNTCLYDRGGQPSAEIEAFEVAWNWNDAEQDELDL